MLLVCVLSYFYLSSTSTSATGTQAKSEVKCYDCMEGTFDSCPAPDFGSCPSVSGPSYCQDVRTVCHLVLTYARSDGSPVGMNKTCGIQGNKDCSSTECSCFCLRSQYSGAVTKKSPSRGGFQTAEDISMQFQDRYKSYLALKPPDDIAKVLDLSFDISPSSPNGYIAHFEVGRKAFISLYLDKSRLVLKFDIGAGPATIKSNTTLQMNGMWHSVKATRRGTKGVIDVDGTKATGKSRALQSRIRTTKTEMFTKTDRLRFRGKFQLLIGGGPHPNDQLSTLAGFSGCLKKLRVNGKAFQGMATRLLGGRSVSECGQPHPCKSFKTDCGDGGACVIDYPSQGNSPYCYCAKGFLYSSSACLPGPDVCRKGYYKCYNGGTCVYDGKRVHCRCRQLFGGKQCELKGEDKCLKEKNGKRIHKCVKDDYCQYSLKADRLWCKCPIGRDGSTCSQVIKSGYSARFHEISYAEYNPYFPNRAYTNIELEIKTQRSDGLLLYLPPSKTNREFFAIGLKKGHPECLLSFGGEMLIAQHDYTMYNNKWYRISVTRLGSKVTLSLNRKEKVFQDGNIRAQLFMTGKTIFLGGIPILEEVANAPEYQATLNGRYPHGFRGCIKNFKMTGRRIDIFRSAVKGTDVSQC